MDDIMDDIMDHISVTHCAPQSASEIEQFCSPNSLHQCLSRFFKAWPVEFDKISVILALAYDIHTALKGNWVPAHGRV